VRRPIAPYVDAVAVTQQARRALGPDEQRGRDRRDGEQSEQGDDRKTALARVNGSANGGQASQSSTLMRGRRCCTDRASVSAASTSPGGTACGPLESRTDPSNRSKSDRVVMPVVLRSVATARRR
jgi:hypothetical protein